MNKLDIIIKLLIIVVLALYISIIVINKKTIEEYNNKNSLEYNIDILRGLIWANYTFITITFAIVLTIIVTKNKYKKYKLVITLSILYILLNTSLNIYLDLILKNKVDKTVLNNVYIISSVLNLIYFMLIVYMVAVTNKLMKHTEYTHNEVDEYIRYGYNPNYYNEPSDTVSEYYINDNDEITADNIEVDDELGIVIKPRRY